MEPRPKAKSPAISPVNIINETSNFGKRVRYTLGLIHRSGNCVSSVAGRVTSGTRKNAGLYASCVLSGSFKSKPKHRKASDCVKTNPHGRWLASRQLGPVAQGRMRWRSCHAATSPRPSCRIPPSPRLSLPVATSRAFHPVMLQVRRSVVPAWGPWMRGLCRSGEAEKQSAG